MLCLLVLVLVLCLVVLVHDDGFLSQRSTITGTPTGLI
jgi:hypothetical protein